MTLTSFISIYAAVVSTFVAVWNIYQYNANKKGNIHVEYVPMTTSRSLFARITNRGLQNRTIKAPCLKIPFKIGNADHIFDEINAPFLEYPKELKPGEQISFSFSESFLQTLKSKGVNKVKVVIQDTFDKDYKTKWINV